MCQDDEFAVTMSPLAARAGRCISISHLSWLYVVSSQAPPFRSEGCLEGELEKQDNFGEAYLR